MKIVTISDTHNLYEKMNIPYGDVIIHAGDFSNRGYKHDIEKFVKWYAKLPHTWKILIPGNHDILTDPDMCYGKDANIHIFFKELCKENEIELLIDSGCEVIDNEGNTVKIWGSPVQPTFGRGWAWNRDRGAAIKKHWDLIPGDTDILVTHGPPYGHLDIVDNFRGIERVGCEDLMEAIHRVHPFLCVNGHIHESRGVETDLRTPPITYANTSTVDFYHQIQGNGYFCFDWERVKEGKSIGHDFTL